MGWKYHSPPGWPAPPEDWTPPPGWRPDPSWPQAPDDWQFWVPDGADDPTLLFELTDEDGFAAGPLDSVDEFVREQAEQSEQLPVAGVPLGEPAPAIAPVWAAEATGPDAAAEVDAPAAPVAEPAAAALLAAETASPGADPLPEPQPAPAMSAEPVADPVTASAMSAVVSTHEPQLLGCTYNPEVVDAEPVMAAAGGPEAAGQETGPPEAGPVWRDERAALGWPADAGSSAEPAWATAGSTDHAWTAASTAEPAWTAASAAEPARPKADADPPPADLPAPPPAAEPRPEPVADLPPVAVGHEPVPEPAMTSSAGFTMGTDGPAAAPVSTPSAHVPAHAAPHVPAHAKPATPRPWWIWALGGAAGLLLCSVLGIGGFLALRPDGSPSAVAEPGATAVRQPSEAVPSQEEQSRPIPSPNPLPGQAQDQVFEGTGPRTVPVELGDTFHTVALTYAGAGDFVVRTVKADGQEIQTLVATTDSYEGVRPLDLGDIRPAAVNIEASGGWRMVVRPLAASPTWSGTASGVGANVLLIPRSAADSTRVAFDHRGKGKFTVQAIGSDSATLISQEGDYTGETVLPRGTVVVVIDTNGVWTFSRD
ncbi:hypothetical protein CS0771_35310 [Catellatospora sp. IY07-71]|uniref:hypothetical protein n=1 Tax=Catellatospora sp. IY07-71 TaxID=2728827 RepID=UPI001BB31434|nr:hypothetical protein [Catellatospora sp. IY07-71]BCJ73987.1 hypothetical protein CS0771_35310 [Catellatospora sp. IY07-71]